MTIKEKDAIRNLYGVLKDKCEAELDGNCNMKLVTKYRHQMEGIEMVMSYFSIKKED